MEEIKDISEEINRKIEEIQTKIISGDISLLDIELVPIFENLKNSLNISNLDKYFITYKNAYQLLAQKFEELKILINIIDREEGFLTFLKSNPKDSEIRELFNEFWIKPLNVESLSFKFLESSKRKLDIKRGYSTVIEHLDRVEVKNNFLLEVPEQKFTEKMLEFYNIVKNKLPCPFEDIFEDEQNQMSLYENFVYILHLLQLGKIKYQKETNFLYI